MPLKLNKEQFYFFASALISGFINFIKPKKPVQSILVIKLDEIGDMVYALHILEHLKNQYPDAPITLLCKPFVKPLVQNNPAISNIIHEIPLTSKFELIVELRGNWDTLKYALRKMPFKRLDRGTVRLNNKLHGGQKHEVITNFEVIESLLPKGTTPLVPKIICDENSKEFVYEFIIEKKASKFCGYSLRS